MAGSANVGWQGAAVRGSGGSGSRRRRVPQISVHASSTSGMRAQRASSSSGGGGGNPLVSFAPHGYSPSPSSQMSDVIDFQRGVSDWTGESASRATTAPSADASVLRSRVSPNFRQALAEAKERMAARRLVAQSVREQRRSNTNNNHQDSVSRLDGERLVEEEDGSYDDADDVFVDETLAGAASGATGGTVAKQQQPPQDPGTVGDPKRKRALRRWGLVREIIDDIHRERHAKKAEGWSMFFKHVRAMSEAEKTRQDLYERYNILGDGKSNFMTDLPTIEDELLLAAGIPIPSTRARRMMALGGARGGGRPHKR